MNDYSSYFDEIDPQFIDPTELHEHFNADSSNNSREHVNNQGSIREAMEPPQHHGGKHRPTMIKEDANNQRFPDTNQDQTQPQRTVMIPTDSLGTAITNDSTNKRGAQSFHGCIIGHIKHDYQSRTDKFICSDLRCTRATFTRLQDLKRHNLAKHVHPPPQFWCSNEGCLRAEGGKPFPREDKAAAHMGVCKIGKCGSREAADEEHWEFGLFT